MEVPGTKFITKAEDSVFLPSTIDPLQRQRCLHHLPERSGHSNELADGKLRLESRGLYAGLPLSSIRTIFRQTCLQPIEVYKKGGVELTIGLQAPRFAQL